MKKFIWKLLLIVGICPFIIPFVLGVYRMTIESWAMMDWLLMYSYIYWPTYVAGFVLIAVALKRLLDR